MDVGWACGWRNLQMLAYSLLNKAEARSFKELFFGGLGGVPDISSLQAWLERAWNNG